MTYLPFTKINRRHFLFRNIISKEQAYTTLSVVRRENHFKDCYMSKAMNRKPEDARADNLKKNSKAMENFTEIAFLLVVHNSGTSMVMSFVPTRARKGKIPLQFCHWHAWYRFKRYHAAGGNRDMCHIEINFSHGHLYKAWTKPKEASKKFQPTWKTPPWPNTSPPFRVGGNLQGKTSGSLFRFNIEHECTRV